MITFHDLHTLGFVETSNDSTVFEYNKGDYNCILVCNGDGVIPYLNTIEQFKSAKSLKPCKQIDDIDGLKDFLQQLNNGQII